MALAPDFQTANDALSYNPETGDLKWKVTRGARAKAGAYAGVLNDRGYIIVTLEGKKYLGHYLAWYLYHGEWPKGRLTLLGAHKPGATDDQVIDARSDLRIANIDLAEKHLTQAPAAARQRHYARNRADRARRHAERLRTSGNSRFDNVRFDPAKDLWVVYNVPKPREGSPVQLAGFPHQIDAERLAFEVRANLNALLDSNGQDVELPLLDEHTANLRAGFKGPDFASIVQDMAYDPYRGAIFWRSGVHRGFPATQSTTGKTLIIPFHGWRLPAHSVAYFIANGIWPVRGEINPLDGNWHNIALANLHFAAKGSLA